VLCCRLVFSYEILTPAALNFFVSYAEGAVESLWSIDQYFQFVLVLMLSTGLSFQVMMGGPYKWFGSAIEERAGVFWGGGAWGQGLSYTAAAQQDLSNYTVRVIQPVHGRFFQVSLA